jgi:hypothetical protein
MLVSLLPLGLLLAHLVLRWRRSYTRRGRTIRRRLYGLPAAKATLGSTPTLTASMPRMVGQCSLTTQHGPPTSQIETAGPGLMLPAPEPAGWESTSVRLALFTTAPRVGRPGVARDE